jgi:hypothetical protein
MLAVHQGYVLVAVVQPLLRISETLVFVDRNFGPENARHRQVFQAMMNACVAGRLREPKRSFFSPGPLL